MADYKQLRAAIDIRLSTDPEFRTIVKRINGGRATFIDTERYAQITARAVSRELSAEVLNLSDREGITAQILRDSYEDINSICARVQRAMDEKAGIHIRPQQEEFPAERVQQFTHSLVDPTVEDSVIKRRARAGSDTIVKSAHDGFIRKNATFRNDAGLTCYIIREGSNCCEWCSSVAGKYRFGTQPDDIFRRHDNCDCTIIYDGQVLRGKRNADGSRSKTWEEVPNANADYEAASFTQEQAKELERQNLQRFRGLTNGENSGKIKTEGMLRRGDPTHRRIGSEGQQIIDKPTYNKLTKDFLRNGGIIINDQEAIEHLQKRHAHAEYMPSFNAILTTKEPTVSDILEETFHAKQDRLHRFGIELTDEVRLRREIEAQEYLLSMTEKYKIPQAEVELTKKNLKDYQRELEDYLNLKGR